MPFRHPARPQPELRSRFYFCFLFLSSFPSSLPPPSSTNLPPPPSQFASRHVPGSSCPSYPSPAVLFFLFFFIKLPKQQSAAVAAWRGANLLAQLVGPAVTGAQLARRPVAACPPPSPVPMVTSPHRAEP